MLFGRPGGPFRAIVGFIFIGVFLTLVLIIVALNIDLARQEDNNKTTLRISRSLVTVNDKITVRLQQVTDLSGVAAKALDETRALGPLLVQLGEVTGSALGTLQEGESIVRETAGPGKLGRTLAITEDIIKNAVPLGDNAAAFLGQGNQLLGIVQGLVKDVEAALAAATRINNGLPLPRLGG